MGGHQIVGGHSVVSSMLSRNNKQTKLATYAHKPACVVISLSIGGARWMAFLFFLFQLFLIPGY